MDATSIYFAMKLKERIDDRLQVLSTTLMGSGIMSFEQYKGVQGQCVAFNEVLRWMEEFTLEDNSRRKDVNRLSG